VLLLAVAVPATVALAVVRAQSIPASEVDPKVDAGSARWWDLGPGRVLRGEISTWS